MRKGKQVTIYQRIILFIDIKIFDQSITQKIIERTNTILEGNFIFKTDNNNNKQMKWVKKL
jgi:hypothetical protein